MRLSRTNWLVLAIVIFAVGTIVLYMLFQGQTEKRQTARDELEFTQDTVPMLLAQKGALEAELIEKENELTQWEDTISQLEEQVIQVKITLDQNKEGFPVSVESIEYDEKLISFALANDVVMTVLTASELGSETIDGIDYETASFGIEIRGEVADILAFINTVKHRN